jgi:hypothetical protein
VVCAFDPQLVARRDLRESGQDAGATAVCRSSSTSARQIFILKIISAGLKCRERGARKM